MGRFETENQMKSEMPMETLKEGQQARAPVYTNYLKKGAGAQNQMQRRKEFRVRRGDELRGLLGREVLGTQRLMLTQPQQPQLYQQFGARPQMGLGAAQPAAYGGGSAGGIESRLLSKPPLRHWGSETAIVYQPDIDQAPNFKRRVLVQRERTARIHRVRRGVAWDIPVYDRERQEKGGLSWTIPLDSEFYAASSGAQKKSKSKSLLKRFAAGVKRAFKGRRATTKEPKITVRPQQRMAARKRGAPFVARSGLPPQAPVVEKRRVRKLEHTTDAELSKQAAFARAPGVIAPAGVVAAAPLAAAPVAVAEDRGMFVNGRRIHTTHMSEVPLLRQAPAAIKDDDASSAKKADSARAKESAPVVHSKGHAIASQHEQHQQLQHVRTG